MLRNHLVIILANLVLPSLCVSWQIAMENLIKEFASLPSHSVDFLFADLADQTCNSSGSQRIECHEETSDIYASRGLSLISSQSPQFQSVEASTSLTEESIGKEGEVYNSECQVQRSQIPTFPIASISH